MVRAEITDSDSARAWLEGQPHQMQIWFAVRCALRAAPGIRATSDDTFDRLALLSFRASLIPATAAMCPIDEVLKLAIAAQQADYAISEFDFPLIDRFSKETIRSAAYSARAAARTTARHPHSPDSARSANFSAIAAALFVDCAAVPGHSDDTDRVAALSAIDSDTEHPGTWSQLWRDSSMPNGLIELWHRMKATMQAEPEKWAFWLEWYQRILDGDPLPWELSLRIAKEVTEEEWNAGPEIVAERIKSIWQEFEPDPPLTEDSLQKQAKVLLLKRAASETAARGLKSLIQMALDAYCREISNALPEALEPLDRAPPLFNEIATTLSADLSASEKERQLAELVGKMVHVIAVLNHRLRVTHAKLATSKAQLESGTPKRLFAEAFYTKAGEGVANLITSKLLWGSMISGGALILGADADALTKTLGECFQSVIVPEAPEAIPIDPAQLWVPSVGV